MIYNVTLDAANWDVFRPQLVDFAAALPADCANHVSWSPQMTPRAEGLAIPAQVNYVGKGANLYRLGYELDGSVAVITRFLRTTWLWEKIRVQGGAYGGFCSFDRHAGVFSYLSYRDPNLWQTLQNYDRTGQFLRQLDLSQEELTKSIIGAIGAIDTYRLPDAKGYTSMVRCLVGESEEARQQFRDEVLTTTTADFKAFADVLESVKEEGLVVVMGSQEKLESANEEQGDWLRITKVM
jgi:Zn-dependent M16 (insulinase) family peptidase